MIKIQKWLKPRHSWIDQINVALLKNSPYFVLARFSIGPLNLWYLIIYSWKWYRVPSIKEPPIFACSSYLLTPRLSKAWLQVVCWSASSGAMTGSCLVQLPSVGHCQRIWHRSFSVVGDRVQIDCRLRTKSLMIGGVCNESVRRKIYLMFGIKHWWASLSFVDDFTLWYCNVLERLLVCQIHIFIFLLPGSELKSTNVYTSQVCNA